MAITSAGVGSGLDIESLITGLMSIERRPLQFLEQRQSETKSQISAIGKLSSAISDFKSSMGALKSLSSFEIYTATSSDDTVFTATADSQAAAGSYNIDFSNNGSNQLAVAHKAQSAFFTDTTTSTGAAGNITINQAALGQSFTVAIGSGTDSLEDIRDAINNAPDNIGVSATIISVDSGSRIILSSDDTGTDSSMTITDSSGVLGFTDYTVAQDAVFQVNGNTVTSQTNTNANAIQGVTINLTTLGAAGSSQTLVVANDTASVTESVQGFVDAYNTFAGAMSKLETGELKGDRSISRIESRIRGIFNTAPTGLSTSLGYLSEIGITTTSTGDLSLDTDKLEKQLALNFSGVSELLANDAEGYVYRLEDMATEYLAIDGLIDGKKDMLESRSDDLDSGILRAEYRLEIIEKRFRTQFTALDGLVANLSATGNFLFQQLGNLPGSSRN
ncbi:MAG: flagellar filament capping protein FliD [Thiohalomonadales bacterium]